jgi:PAS domain S-box-containing protein
VLEAVAYAAIGFLRSTDPEIEIPTVLRLLGQATGVSRVYVFENVTVDGMLADVERFEWVGPGVKPTSENPRNTGEPYLPNYERYVRLLATGGTIAERTRDAPDAERPALESEGVLSYAVVPVFVGDGWWGYIGFDDCDLERTWTKFELSALRTAAETLGAALERRDLDSSLAEMEQRYRTLIEQARDMFVYADVPEEDDRTIYVSPQIEHILGVTPKAWIEAPGDTMWLSMLHPDDRERVQAEYAEFLNGGPDPQDYRLVRRDGRIVWIRDRAVLIRDPDGKLIEWGVMTDISQLKETEAKLRGAESEYRALVEHLPVVTYTEALKGPNVAMYCSPQIKDLVGYTPEEWMSDPNLWNSICHPDDIDRVNREDEESVGTGHFSSQYRFIARDGRIVWVQDEETLIRDEDGNPMYWLGVLVDITDRKTSEGSE